MRILKALLMIAIFMSAPALSKEIVIGDKLFITTLNDIYINLEESYKDSIVTFEGRLERAMLGDAVPSDPLYAFVYREGPGCCYNDAYAGMYLDYKGKLPPDGSWVRVTGTPYYYEHGEYTDLFLKVSSLKLCPKEGKFTVKD